MDSNEIPAWYERLVNKIGELAINHAQLAGVVANNTKDIAEIQEAETSRSSHTRNFWSSIVANVVTSIMGALAGYMLGKFFH